MEFDNPGNNSARSELSDFSDSESSHEDKKGRKDKGILGGAKKKDKEKKKEKEARYATLGDESSGEDEGKKKSKKKGFQFGSAKKEKKEKKEVKDPKEKKEKKEKEKGKLKLKKLKVDADVDSKAKVEDRPVFGIALAQAVERSRCHDGIKLPVVVRECIDFIEEHGLKVEGIYRSSGVKSKVNKLKVAYNTRKSVSLGGCEPAVVASLLKLFLRELPDPVLTHQLMAKFEDVCAAKETGDTVTNLRKLLDSLPDCNRTLVDWIFVHMGHVIQYEKLNKMSLQNVSIVLSPTMKISHRVLYCLFKHSIPLFGHVNIKKYVPPISGQQGVNLLPESPHAIEEEMKKQESLLEDLHREISKGKASKDTEEKLWEQQRIVTQLKRKLRLAKAQMKVEEAKPDHEEELNFSLQKPCDGEGGAGGGSVTTGEVIGKEKASASGSSSAVGKPESSDKKILSSPEEKDDSGQEHRVTVQIHQPEQGNDPSKGNVTVIKLSQNEAVKSSVTQSISKDIKTTGGDNNMPEVGEKDSLKDKDKVDGRSEQPRPVQPQAVQQTVSLPANSQQAVPSQVLQVKGQDEVDRAAVLPSSGVEPRLDSTKVALNKKVSDYENVDVKFKKVDFKPAEDGGKMSAEKIEAKDEKNKDDIPLLPPPPASTKPSSRGLLKVIQPQEAKMKSKSLPRGLPSDTSTLASAPNTATYSVPASQASVPLPVGTNAGSQQQQQHPAAPLPAQQPQQAVGSTLPPPGAPTGQQEIPTSERKIAGDFGPAPGTEDLLWEEMRLKFQYEELLNLKSELERKKKMERREISELHEEIATMQTLYQYRTYSVDSSEDSDVEEEHFQQVEDNRAILRELMLEQAELQQKKSFLLDKLDTERQVCLNLRVQIRMEQEKLRKRGLLHMS
eukprot:TRINITY_DN3823_c0_g1_i10.p1 TRINITY_DN3823_c0_g1~~TRINITY_DN3823_c0_g1_i10.p1  ORF type:complete len:897 (-),score=332.25 TRINITY_DN3823_c0_g1_i10:478-3168(-)